MVAAYFARRSAKLGRSGLRVTLAAIAFHHRRSGHLWSSADPAIASVMQGILRQQRKPVRPAAALTSEELRALLAGCGDDLGGVRGRALLLTGFAGLLRRYELVGLDVADLRFGKDGVILRIRHSKRDQEGEGADVGVAFGQHSETCPVAALRTWLERGKVRYGPVFRNVTASGALGLTVHDIERLTPHGLHAGFITEADLNGALNEQVAHHARQSDLETTRGYRRRAKTADPRVRFPVRLSSVSASGAETGATPASMVPECVLGREECAAQRNAGDETRMQPQKSETADLNCFRVQSPK